MAKMSLSYVKWCSAEHVADLPRIGALLAGTGSAIGEGMNTMTTQMTSAETDRALWNTLREIQRIGKSLGFYTHIDSGFNCQMEVTFRAVDAKGNRVGSDAGYLGIARTMNHEAIKLSDRVPQVIRDAVAHLL